MCTYMHMSIERPGAMAAYTHKLAGYLEGSRSIA